MCNIGSPSPEVHGAKRCTPQTFPEDSVPVSDEHDFWWHRGYNTGICCVEHAEEISQSIANSRPGFLGIRWFQVHNQVGSVTSMHKAADKIENQNLSWPKQSGHSTACALLSKGILQMRAGKSRRHFTTDNENVDMLATLIESSNQRCMFLAMLLQIIFKQCHTFREQIAEGG